jgi:hypothetical protein
LLETLRTQREFYSFWFSLTPVEWCFTPQGKDTENQKPIRPPDSYGLVFFLLVRLPYGAFFSLIYHIILVCCVYRVFWACCVSWDRRFIDSTCSVNAKGEYRVPPHLEVPIWHLESFNCDFDSLNMNLFVKD